MAHPAGSRDRTEPPQVGPATRIMLRPLGSSLPMGFFAFGMGSILLTSAELRWVPLDQVHMLMVLSLAFVVPLELLGGIFAFLARDGGAATSLCVFSCAWAGNAVVTLLGPPGARSAAIGVFLLTGVPIMLALFVGALSGKPALAALLLLGAARFGLAGGYQVTDSRTLETVAGWVGVVLGAFALYGGLALLLEDGSQRTVLPIGRIGRARSSLDGHLGHQLKWTEREAGVRRML